MPTFFAPEVIQTSAMDCGPAALKCLLDGFGRPVSYGRLREACQTSIDGTSIDALEEVALQLGLEAEQIMIPADHLFLPSAGNLPALIVVVLPNGFTHFVVMWRQFQGWLQLMDPATGRRWVHRSTFLKEVYHHKMQVPAEAWREWASSEQFQNPLTERLAQLGLTSAQTQSVWHKAIEDENWHTLAALDGATRLTQTLVNSQAVQKGGQAWPLLQNFLNQPNTIPDHYWSVRPVENDPEQVWLKGAVLLRVKGTQPAGASSEQPPLTPELAAALAESSAHPLRELWQLLRADGYTTPAVLLLTALLTAGSLFLEALLLQNLFQLVETLTTMSQRVAAVVAFLLFVSLNLGLHYLLDLNIYRFARRLETRLRIAFLSKLPRMADRYFNSRPVSDMADRGHHIHQLRLLPTIAQTLLQSFTEVVLMIVGMMWLNPSFAPLTLLVGLFALLLPLLFQPMMSELDLRVRTHQGALAYYYLDVLLGLMAVKAYRAERAMQREYEKLLAEWVKTKYSYAQTSMWMEQIQLLVVTAGVIWLIFDYVQQGRSLGGLLLLTYWGLTFTYRSREIARALRQYVAQRNITMRLVEPLRAPEEVVSDGLPPAEDSLNNGVAITWQEVTIQAAGHTILENLSCYIPAGSHVALVGLSGAGKTSLISTLLGWHKPTAGEILVNGQLLTAERLALLRQHTAWVDPAVQVWNRSLLDNLRYGQQSAAPPSAFILAQADLLQLLEKLPQGLQTPLGEGGGLVSGGEGQRVRLGRAMTRPGVQLVLLDEPFRGLGRQQRHDLLQRARQLWREATLICITHDVGETLPFDRVLVMEGGQILEDGSPAELSQQNSRYQQLLQAEETLHQELWHASQWRKMWVANGQAEERKP